MRGPGARLRTATKQRTSCVPLTPALSPQAGEREQCGSSLRQWAIGPIAGSVMPPAARRIKRSRALLPLLPPGGEGRGEGPGARLRTETKQRTSCVPLTPALSPASRGEGAQRVRASRMVGFACRGSRSAKCDNEGSRKAAFCSMHQAKPRHFSLSPRRGERVGVRGPGARLRPSSEAALSASPPTRPPIKSRAGTPPHAREHKRQLTSIHSVAANQQPCSPCRRLTSPPPPASAR